MLSVHLIQEGVRVRHETHANLVDRAPQVGVLSLISAHQLVHMPCVAWPPLAVSQLFREFLADLQTPLAHSRIADEYATRGQEFFDSTKTETEAVIQPHGVAHDLGWEAVVLIERTNRRCAHTATASLRLTLDKHLNNLTMPFRIDDSKYCPLLRWGNVIFQTSCVNFASPCSIKYSNRKIPPTRSS